MLAGATGRPHVSHLPPTAAFYFSDAGEGTEAAQRKRGSSRGRSASAYTHATGFHKEPGTERACKKGDARREPWSSPAAALQPSATWQGCAGLLTASSCSAAALFSSTQQQWLSDQVCVMRLQQFSLPSHLLLSKSFFNRWAGSMG